MFWVEGGKSVFFLAKSISGTHGHATAHSLANADEEPGLSLGSCLRPSGSMHAHGEPTNAQMRLKKVPKFHRLKTLPCLPWIFMGESCLLSITFRIYFRHGISSTLDRSWQCWHSFRPAF